MSQRLPCASLALIIVVHPSDCCVHPSHTSLSRMVPAAKIQTKARMDHQVSRHANMMGSFGYVKVGSRHASCPDKVAVLAWVADVPSMHHHVGGRHASCCWWHCCHPKLGLS